MAGTCNPCNTHTGKSIIKYKYKGNAIKKTDRIHIFLTSLHARDGLVEELVQDLKKAIEIVKNDKTEAKNGLVSNKGSSSDYLY